MNDKVDADVFEVGSQLQRINCDKELEKIKASV